MTDTIDPARVSTNPFLIPLGDRPSHSPRHRDPSRRSTFPRHNPTVGLQRHRYGYTSEVTPGEANLHGAVIKHDVESGASEVHEFGLGRGGAEPVVVPKTEGPNEDDCWILTVVYDATTDTRELHVLDAADITSAAVTQIALPQRVPYGFHGNWVPVASVAP